MPQPRPAVRAKSALQRVTRVGRARPKLGRAPCQAKRRERHDDRYAKGGGRLLPAFFAMAYIEFTRAARKLIAYRAALATAARNAVAHPLFSRPIRSAAPWSRSNPRSRQNARTRWRNDCRRGRRCARVGGRPTRCDATIQAPRVRCLGGAVPVEQIAAANRCTRAQRGREHIRLSFPLARTKTPGIPSLATRTFAL